MNNVAVEVKGVTMRFNMPKEKVDNIKFLEAENYKTELRAELKSEAENMIITIKNTQYEHQSHTAYFF